LLPTYVYGIIVNMSVEKIPEKVSSAFDVANFLAAALVKTLEHSAEVQKKAEADRKETKEISDYAFRDHLTGLYNRRYLEEAYDRLRIEVPRSAGLHRRAHEAADPSTLIVLDLDKFKVVNDTHGHKRGDEVLKQTASHMLQRARATDLAGRWGGEEFVIILPHSSENAGLSVAEGVRKLIEKDGIVTASFGVAEIGPEDLALYSMDEMMVRADLAMYAAKEAGRNQVISYSQMLADS
jgi:diguanylate cyclase (GGDEF)-like protein